MSRKVDAPRRRADRPRLLDHEDPVRVPQRGGDVNRRGEVAELGQRHGRGARRPGNDHEDGDGQSDDAAHGGDDGRRTGGHAVRPRRSACRAGRAARPAPARAPRRARPLRARRRGPDVFEDGVGHGLLLVARGLLDALVAQRLAVLDRDGRELQAPPIAHRDDRGPPPARSRRPTRAPGARSLGARSPIRPVRERPPSQYMATQPPSSRTFSAVTKVSSSRCPRRTGKTPPWV